MNAAERLHQSQQMERSPISESVLAHLTPSPAAIEFPFLFLREPAVE
jgi:hypothetical protein